ncbi:MAG: hypothetical protein UHH95_01530 [Oscillospiraceae bacterium]|nr:hypothetical protein [Oscillospiraceae bacterium]
MNVLLVALIIVLSVLALILVLLLFPVRLNVSYIGDKTQVFLRYLFIKVRLLPQDKKKGSKKGEKNQEKKIFPPSQPQKGSDDGFIDRLEALLAGISSAGRVVRLILSMHNASIDLTARVGGQDAAEIAVECGRLSAYLHSALAVIANTICVKKRKITVVPDYDSKKTLYSLYARLWFLPIRLIFHVHEIIPELLRISDALPDKNKKGEKRK